MVNNSEEELLAMVSHELRTPLIAVLAYAHLLGSGRLDPVSAADALRTIERNAKAMDRIIEDLLDVSAPMGGHVCIAPEPVDLVAVIHCALDDVRPVADGAGLSLTFACHATAVAVAGDALRLQQVVANLLSNAVKFTPCGGHIALGLTAAGSGVELRVSDTGQGISADFLPRIFDRFARADVPGSRQHGGLGLGLALVRALVEGHGGTVQAASAGHGRGATLTVWLPALECPATAVGPRSNGAAGPRSNGQPHGPSSTLQ
jgi:signal transduction histidine kinase